MIFIFWMLSFKPAFSLSFTFIKRLFSSSLFSAIRVVSSAYLRLLIFLLAILIPAYASSSLVFRMLYSAKKLNNQGNNTALMYSFPILNQSIFQCPVLSVASWPAYRFLRRQVRWLGIPISWRIVHSLLWSTLLKALHSQWSRRRCFSEILLLFLWSTDVGNFLSCSSAFSKFRLYIWKFLIHILLKPDLENFEHYFASMWDECSCVVVWTNFGTDFLWNCNENWPFPIPVATAEFSKFAGILNAALSQHHLLRF